MSLAHKMVLDLNEELVPKEQLRESRIRILKGFFDSIDADGSGFIEFNELEVLMTNLAESFE